MAYLLSFSFSVPLCHRHTRFQGSYTRRLNGGKILNPLTSRTANKHLLLPKYSCGDMIPFDESHHCNIYSSPRQLLKPVSCQIGLCSIAHVQISGFWMGPDVEDGWGFVEAYVVDTSSNYTR